jgi:hypothetical protein
VIWLKQVVLGNAFSQIGITGEFKKILYHDYFSADTIGFMNFDIPLWVMLVFSGIFGLVCLAVSYLMLYRRFKDTR